MFKVGACVMRTVTNEQVGFLVLLCYLCYMVVMDRKFWSGLKLGSAVHGRKKEVI